MGGAVAATVAAAGAASVVGAQPAAASNGGSLTLGQTSTATNPTLLWDSSGVKKGGASVFTVSDTNDVGAAYPAAISGFGNGVSVNNGIYGWSGKPGGVGVIGRAVGVGGHGVKGIAAKDGFGVLGESAEDRAAIGGYHYKEGIGVYAQSDGGTGFAAWATKGTAFNGHAETGLYLFADLHMRLGGGKPAPWLNPEYQLKGDMVFDTNGELWACVAEGQPGTWRKITGPSAAGAFHVLPATKRVYDSRNGYQPNNGAKGQLSNGATRSVDCSFGGAVPIGATAVQVNLTIVNTSAAGFLALFKNGIPWPGNSSINWSSPGSVVANNAVVALDGAAKFAAYVNQGCSTDFVVDVIGYYR